MIPVWIFDFIKKGSIESFLSNYHNALTQNDPTMDPARWFHVTEGLNEDYSQAVLEQTAQALLVDNAIDGKMVQKLIPVWNNRTNRFLNVIFTGDIDDEATQKHLISSAVFLLKNRTYFPGASVRFYALLWRSSASTVEPGLSPGAFQFMKDLKAMLDLDENNRFHKVLFFESSLLPEEKAKAMESMALATLQIAVHEDLAAGHGAAADHLVDEGPGEEGGLVGIGAGGGHALELVLGVVPVRAEEVVGVASY